MESRARVLVVDGTVVMALPVAYASLVAPALRRAINDARGLGAPTAAMRPLADVAEVLERAAADAARAAQTAASASECGHLDRNALDAGGPVPHRAHDELVSIADLAKRTSRGARQLRRLADLGRLPGASKVGDRWVVDLEEFESASATRDVSRTSAARG